MLVLFEEYFLNLCWSCRAGGAHEVRVIMRAFSVRHFTPVYADLRRCMSESFFVVFRTTFAYADLRRCAPGYAGLRRLTSVTVNEIPPNRYAPHIYSRMGLLRFNFVLNYRSVILFSRLLRLLFVLNYRIDKIISRLSGFAASSTPSKIHTKMITFLL